jgi:hypothetical protein
MSGTVAALQDETPQTAASRKEALSKNASLHLVGRPDLPVQFRTLRFMITFCTSDPIFNPLSSCSPLHSKTHILLELFLNRNLFFLKNLALSLVLNKVVPSRRMC